MLLGHPEQRFDGIGADRQANLVETEGLGGLELILEIARNSRRTACEGMVSISGAHCANVACERPWVLSSFWHANSGMASSRNRLIKALHAGKASRQVRNFARVEPALAPPAGERWSKRSAQVTRRCTFIKRALVCTLGGARHARSVCLSLPETRPHADTKIENVR